MKPSPQPAGSRATPTTPGPLHPAGLEARLRALHEVVPLALEFPALIHPYLEFLRELRARLHPIGVPEPRRIEVASGLSIQVDLGSRLGAEIYYGFFSELFDCALFMEMLDEGLAVADVGANFGLYALSAAQRVRAAGPVHAFEPDPSAFALLTANAKANGLTNLVCHETCVGETDGSVDFHIMEDSAFSGLTVTGRSRLRSTRVVRMHRLDSVLSAAHVGALGALKIDVEGHEFSVLRGARETIERSADVVLMVEVSSKNLDAERQEALEAEMKALYEQGFAGWVADTGPDGLRRLADAQATAGLGSANVFLVRAGTAREDRLRASARDLRAKALAEIVEGGAAGDRESDSARPLDARDGLHLHTALVGAVVADRDARLQAVEEDSQARLREIHRLTAARQAAEEGHLSPLARLIWRGLRSRLR